MSLHTYNAWTTSNNLLSDCVVESIIPDSQAGLFESFTSDDLGVSIYQNIFNIRETEYEDWCSGFSRIFSKDDPIIQTSSDSCGIPILEPVVLEFTSPESNCEDVSWIYSVSSSDEEVNFDRSRDRAFVDASSNSITIDFKGEDDTSTIEFTL